MSQRAARPGGQSRFCGRRAPTYADGLPGDAELRELSARLGAHSKISRCGRPGLSESTEGRQHLEKKLKEAAKGGRGLKFLTRDEVDALLASIQKPSASISASMPVSPLKTHLKQIANKGGTARAARLSRRRRKEIARLAAAKRWQKNSTEANQFQA